jgi:hypothetical protein
MLRIHWFSEQNHWVELRTRLFSEHLRFISEQSGSLRSLKLRHLEHNQLPELSRSTKMLRIGEKLSLGNWKLLRMQEGTEHPLVGMCLGRGFSEHPRHHRPDAFGQSIG